MRFEIDQFVGCVRSWNDPRRAVGEGEAQKISERQRIGRRHAMARSESSPSKYPTSNSRK